MKRTWRVGIKTIVFFRTGQLRSNLACRFRQMGRKPLDEKHRCKSPSLIAKVKPAKQQ
ncbi:hypothetical protein O9992_10705 [Vibrio lentus]|nr:hypothetical protein [Vibrio lentus]